MGTIGGVGVPEVAELPSAHGGTDSVLMSSEVGQSWASIGTGSSFCSRRKPGNESNRFGEAERAGLSSTGGSTWSC